MKKDEIQELQIGPWLRDSLDLLNAVTLAESCEWREFKNGVAYCCTTTLSLIVKIVMKSVSNILDTKEQRCSSLLQ